MARTGKWVCPHRWTQAGRPTHEDTPLVMTARHGRLRSMICLVTFHSGTVTQTTSGILTPVVTRPHLSVTSIHRDRAGGDPQRQQAASTDTPSEIHGHLEREPRRHAQSSSRKWSSMARHADERTRESGRIRGAAQGCPPTWSLHLHIQGFGGREVQTAFSPLCPLLGGTGAPSSALCWREAPVSRPPQPLGPAGGNCETHPPPPPVPALQEQRTGTNGTRKARLPGGWKWKPVV